MRHEPDHQAVYGYLRDLEAGARSAPPGISAGSIGYSAGGPVWLDAFRSKRPPQPHELVNAYKAVAFACVQLNARGVARVPLRLYAKTARTQAPPRRSHRAPSIRTERYIRSLPGLSRSLADDATISEVMEHPFLDALDAPNDYFDGNLFLNFVCASLDVVGAAYMVPERPMRADGSVDASVAMPGMKLWGLQSQYVFPVKGMGDRVLDCYRYFGDTYTPEQVLRIRFASLRDPYLSPYAPLHAAFEQVGLGDYYTATIESIMKNGGRPSALVGPSDPNQPFDESTRRRLEVDLNNRTGQGRSGQILVSGGAYTWTPMAYTPTDLSGLEISKEQRLLVANCFDVPISLLQTENSNRAVAAESTHAHQYYSIAPRCVLIAAALTHQWARPVDDRLFFAFDDAVGRDMEREAKIFDLRVKNGSISINEYRAAEGEEPVAWGDEPWFLNTLVQPSLIALQAQAALEATQATTEAANEPRPDPIETPGDVEPVEPDGGKLRSQSNAWEQVTRTLDLIEQELHDRRSAGAGRGHGDPWESMAPLVGATEADPGPGQPAGE
jgi:phage portal protein BeeE